MSGWIFFFRFFKLRFLLLSFHVFLQLASPPFSVVRLLAFCVFGFWAQSCCFSYIFFSLFTFILPSLYKCVRVSVGMFECKCVWVCSCMEGYVNSRKKALTSSFITLVSGFYRQFFFCFHFLKNLRRDYIAFVYSTYVFHDFFFYW